MKKILLSTVVLIAFSLSIVLFQISCKKDAVAETPTLSAPIATTNTLGLVKPDGTTIKIDATGKISAVSTNSPTSADIVVYSKLNATKTEIWKVNIDGSQNQKINIVLPAGVEFNVNDGGAFKLTKDASKLIFQAKTTVTDKGSLYSCNIDGSSVKKIVDGLDELQLGDAN
ncbi:hypothetical protein ABIB62_001574 [Mucilaginibacter sp. UYP25]|uniref:hypothetical protein n=1 Tax=unclassified Mucilaginibacter TaxID=2617802 RepID=UPI0033954B2A